MSVSRESKKRNKRKRNPFCRQLAKDLIITCINAFSSFSSLLSAKLSSFRSLFLCSRSHSFFSLFLSFAHSFTHILLIEDLNNHHRRNPCANRGVEHQQQHTHTHIIHTTKVTGDKWTSTLACLLREKKTVLLVSYSIPGSNNTRGQNFPFSFSTSAWCAFTDSLLSYNRAMTVR